VILEIIVVIKNVSVNDFSLFFWFCDFAPAFFALAFFMKNNQMIKGLINIGFITQVAALIGGSIFLLTGLDLFGFGNILNNMKIFQVGVFLFVHAYSTSLALFSTYKTEIKPLSLIYSLAFLSFMFISSTLFTPFASNINYVFYLPTLSNFIPFYSYLWIILTFCLIVLPTYLLQRWLYKINR
jgi:hypothetical protein